MYNYDHLMALHTRRLVIEFCRHLLFLTANWHHSLIKLGSPDCVYRVYCKTIHLGLYKIL